MNPIRDIRRKLGLTQRELAQALNVSQPQISKFENGEQEMPPDVARTLIHFAQTKGKRFTFNDIYVK